MNCAACRKSIKKEVIKCIPCDKTFHPGCVALHKVLDMTGRLVPCGGETVKLLPPPTSPVSDIFVDASSALTPTFTSTTVITTTMATSSIAVTTTSLAAPRPSYRVSSTVLQPAPTTDLSQLCADVRAVLMSQAELKTTLQSNTAEVNRCTEQNVALRETMTSLTAQIDSKFEALTLNYAEVSSKICNLEASFAALRKQVDNLQVTCASSSSVACSSEIKAMSEQIRRLEQEQSSRDLIVSGLPETHGENLSSVVIRLAEVIQVNLSVSDIVSVKRLPSNIPRSQAVDRVNKPRAILIRLSSAVHKKSLLEARRLKGRLLANEVSSSMPSKLVRINDFIPRDAWTLLKTVRAAARERGYRFAWYSRGHVLVKKDVDASPIRITHVSDIDAVMQ